MGENLGEYHVLRTLLHDPILARKIGSLGLGLRDRTIKYRGPDIGLILGRDLFGSMVFGNVFGLYGQGILCHFVEGLGMKKEMNLVDHYNQWFEENNKKRQPETKWRMENLIDSGHLVKPVIEPVDLKAQVSPYREVVEKLEGDPEYKSFPGTPMCVAKGTEFHARMERVIRESLSDFELDHLEVKITQVGEMKYSVEVDYGVDSSLIRREKTSQLDKSNKYTDWKFPEGGQIRLLGKPMEYAHYRVNSEAEFSSEDVEKIKESWSKAKSADVCHEVKKVEDPIGHLHSPKLVESMRRVRRVKKSRNPDLYYLHPGHNMIRFFTMIGSYDCHYEEGKIRAYDESSDLKKQRRFKALVLDRRDNAVKLFDFPPEIAYQLRKIEGHHKYGSLKGYDVNIYRELDWVGIWWRAIRL